MKRSRTITCVNCSAVITNVSNDIICKNCDTTYTNFNNTPILTLDSHSKSKDIDYRGKLHSYSSAELGIPFINELIDSDLYTLQIGSGDDRCDSQNIVKTDAFVYSDSIDYIIDAHCLPFPDDTFDRVYSLAVFEHLHSPWLAAKEIHRVLKPGGKCYTLTAFMQHMHGYPDHYFNMTVSGLEHIFKDFKIEACRPSAFSTFDQLSYIFLDYCTLVNKIDLDTEKEKHRVSLKRLFKEFCEINRDLSDDLMNTNNDIESWRKIAPGIELIGQKI